MRGPNADSSRRTYLKTIGGATVVGLAGCAASSGQTIVPGTAPGFPPFELKEGGELVGFDIDLLTAVVEETEFELGEWQEFEFSSLIPALQNDEIDVIAAAMTVTDERDETIDFTDPYYSADQAVLVREGGSYQPSSLGDLSGNAVGAQEGTTGAGVVQSQLIEPGDLSESNFTTYGSYVLAVEDLVNENLNAVVVDTPVARTFAANRPVDIAFVYETGERYGFGLRDGADDTASSLNEGLQAVRDSGDYEEIRNEWFSGN